MALRSGLVDTDLMLTQDQTERYARHILLREIGAQGQMKLLAARVLVVGAGGIGAPLIQYLAAAGVGLLGIVDDDEVSLSNLQRQIIYGVEDVGARKTDAAENWILRQNPDIQIIKHTEKITSANAEHIIADYDLVVEGIDNFDGRYVLNKACIALRKPLLSSAVGRFDGQVALFKSFDAPGVLPCYRCFAPEAPPRADQVNCAEEGVLGPVTGVIGAIAAMEAIKEITATGESLAGKLLIYDGLKATFRTVTLPADPACPDCLL